MPPATANPHSHAIALSIAGMTATLSIGVACFVELLLAYPLPGWLYATAATVLGLCGVSALLPLRHTWSLRETLHATWILCALLVLIALNAVPWTSRKPFLAKLWQVRIGMTYEEVEQTMAGYLQGTGWRTPGGEVRTPGTLVFRHSKDGRFNSDWGMVTFADGRVIKIEFSPD